MKYNQRVTKRDYGVKGVLNHGNGNSRDYYKQRQEKTMEKVTEATLAQDLRVQEGKNRMDAINQRRMNEQRIVPALNRILKEGKDTLFKDIMCVLYEKSLYLDDWFIDENREAINNFASTYVAENGGYSLLESAVRKTNNPFLVKLKKVIESNANRAVTRINKELKNDKDIDPSTVPFSFDEEEESQFNMDKEELALDEIAEVVKDKVLTVVKDEQQRSELEKNLEQDIKNEAEPVDESTDEEDTEGDDDTTGDDDVKESATAGDASTFEDPNGKKVGVMDNSTEEDEEDADEDDVTESTEDEDIDDENVKESAFKTRAPFIELQKGISEATLFNTIMQESMKEQMMESSVAFRNAGYALSDDDADEDGYNYDVNASIDDVIRDEFLGDSDINDEIDGHDVREMPPAIDMDLILAESVSKYTLLEVANTINLKTMDRNEIRNYVQKALNQK